MPDQCYFPDQSGVVYVDPNTNWFVAYGSSDVAGAVNASLWERAPSMPPQQVMRVQVSPVVNPIAGELYWAVKFKFANANDVPANPGYVEWTIAGGPPQQSHDFTITPESRIIPEILYPRSHGQVKLAFFITYGDVNLGGTINANAVSVPGRLSV